MLLLLRLLVSAQHETNSLMNLRITIRDKDLKQATSCRHASGQIELHNDHATESVEILSLYATPEETSWLNAQTLEPEYWGDRRQEIPDDSLPLFVDAVPPQADDDDPSVPPHQVRVGLLSGRNIVLGPGQVAILPLTLLPRFPANHEFHNMHHQTATATTTTMALEPPAASPSPVYERADWDQWMDSMGILETAVRHNKQAYAEGRWLFHPPQYQVRTTVVVQGKQGAVQIPLTGFSEVQNDYGLPSSITLNISADNITTQDDDDKNTENVWVVSRVRPSPTGSVPDESFHKESLNHVRMPASDCFDIYMRHPYHIRESRHLLDPSTPLPAHHSEEELRVTAISTSHSDRAHVKVLAEREPDAFLQSQAPRQVIREWTDYGGSLLLPSDGQAHYLATVCATPPGVDLDYDMSMVEFSFLPDMALKGKWTDALLAKDFVRQGQYANSLGYLLVQVENEESPLLIALDKAESSEAEAWDDTGFFDAFRDDAAATTQLAAFPESIQHTFLSSSEAESKPSSKAFSIELSNDGLEWVQVLHASILVRSAQPSQYSNGAVSLDISHMSTELADAIPPRTVVDDAVTVTCSVDWEKLANEGSRSLSMEGSVIVRAVVLPDDDDHEMDDDEFVRNSIVAEIPLTIHVMAGRIGVLVQGTSHPVEILWDMRPWSEEYDTVSRMFFPLTQHSARVAIAEFFKNDEKYLPLAELKAIDHHLRVFSGMETEMSLVEATILDAHKNSEFSSSSLCNRFEVTVATGTMQDIDVDIPDEQEMGLIGLRYRFPSTTLYNKEQKRAEDALPTLCHLRFTTSPDSGKHSLPLVIYPGHIDVSGSPFHSSVVKKLPNWNIPEDEDESASWYRAIVGFENLVDWFHSSRTGSALRSVLASSMTGHSGADRERNSILLGRYLYSLARQSVDLESSKLKPVLLKVGAIAQGQVETLPLYLTNHNPVTVSVSIDVGEVEGMSISLGREESSGSGDGNNLLDHLPLRTSTNSSDTRIQFGRFAGHPINGLRNFLLRDKTAYKLLSQFPFRDSISISALATTQLPLLKSLFRTHSQGKFHRSSIPKRESGGICSGTEYPPPYEPFGRKLPERRLPGPVIVSIDGKKLGALRVCSGREGDADTEERNRVFIPPGGVARFDISLRSPPGAALDRDITQLIATGLVLSTSEGEVIPVFVSFESLKGKLEVSHVPVLPNSGHGDGIIQVPVGLFGKQSMRTNETLPSVHIPRTEHERYLDANRSDDSVLEPFFHDKGVSLFMRSSFSRDIKLRRIASCNPWFNVEMSEGDLDMEPDPLLGVSIGAVTSVVTCDTEHDLTGMNATSFPSFFRCVLNWIKSRAELQPRGCGLLPMKESIANDGDDRFFSSEQGGMEHAIDSLRRAVTASEFLNDDHQSYSISEMSTDRIERQTWTQGVKSGYHGSDGLIAPTILKVAADAWDAWKTLAGLGLRTISTTLRAIVEYNSTADEKPISNAGSTVSATEDSHVLSVTIRNLTVESVLALPLLCDIDKAQQALPGSTRGDDTTPSILKVPATAVGDVTFIKLPVRNPTAVPVRVRLAVSSLRGKALSDSIESSQHDPIVERFLGDSQAPYVHTGMLATPEVEHDANRQWWGPDGGYFQSDLHGDVIRSHQNVTIKAGSGAQFSLINPSVMFNTAFLVGCGTRCGIADEATSKTTPFVPGLVDLSPSSPIGASAGEGFVLVGHKRNRLALENTLDQSKMVFGAGGSLMTGGNGPSAFAVPYSALDEVIIPPHGEAELGPVLFRPPGRNQGLGCTSIARSNSMCKSQTFDSVILLENSLTGVERVALRGPTKWESLIFLDPAPLDDEDAFGDIEMRNGRSTLVFPGTADRSSGSPESVLKEVVLHNSGDSEAIISRVYLSPLDGSGHDGVGRCREGDFLLVPCSVGRDDSFRLLPGENRSLFVEHFPRCRKKKEVAKLTVIREFPGDQATTLELSNVESGSTIHVGAFRSRVVDLGVGFEMSRSDFSACVPVAGKESPNNLHKSVWIGLKSTAQHGDQQTTMQWMIQLVVLLVSYAIKFVFVFCWSSLLARSLLSIQDDSSKLQVFLKRGQLKGKPKDSSNKSQMGNTWSAAFRCLARVDPPPLDLQTLGREQTRQIVLLRYRMMGAMPPPGVATSAGIMHRERNLSGANSGKARQLSDGRVVQGGGNERMRTLSDGLFGRTIQQRPSELGMVPCLLGWRTAVARGVISSTSLSASPLTFTTKELLEHRSSHSLPIENGISQSDGLREGEGSISFHSSADDLDISEEVLSEEEDEATEEEEEVEEVPSASSPVVASVSVQTPERPKAIAEKAKTNDTVTNGEKKEPGSEKRATTLKLKNKAKEARSTAEETKQSKGERGHRKVNGSPKIADTSQSATKDLKDDVSADKARNTKANKIGTPDSEPRAISSSKRESTKTGRVSKEGQGRERQKKPSTAVQGARTKHSTQGTREKKSPKPKSQQSKSAWKTPANSPPISPAPGSPPILRPPPGLAPPPGFPGGTAREERSLDDRSGIPTMQHNKTSIIRQKPLTAPTTSVPPRSRMPTKDSRAVSATSLTSDANPSLSEPSSPLLLGSERRSVPLLDPILPPTTAPVVPDNGEFDVMAFLDDILNEPSTSMDEGAGADLDNPTESQPLPAFSPNPWASTTDTYQSRAAAYGISIEDESHRPADPEPLDVPLLTPEAILNASIGGNKEDKNQGGLFYADLLRK